MHTQCSTTHIFYHLFKSSRLHAMLANAIYAMQLIRKWMCVFCSRIAYCIVKSWNALFQTSGSMNLMQIWCTWCKNSFPRQSIQRIKIVISRFLCSQFEYSTFLFFVPKINNLIDFKSASLAYIVPNIFILLFPLLLIFYNGKMHYENFA